MEKRFRLYIDGNGYGFGNIGDDAILQGIIRILTEVPAVSEITVGVKDGIRLPFLERGLNVIRSFDLPVAQQMIDSSDCFVIGGGTMIGDELGIGFPLVHNVERILYAERRHKKIVLFGIGANKPMSKPGKELAKIMVHHSGLITVRDQESLSVCKTFSRSPQDIFQTSDPAFLLHPCQTERSKMIKELIRSKGKTIGINVVNEVWANKKGYKKAIASACSELSRKHNIFPVFISNEIRPGAFFDYEANKETASFLDCESILLEPAYYSPEEMIDIISAFDLFLSMRMHGLIFASIANVPFVTVSRIDKVDNFMHQFNFKPSGTTETITAGTLLEDIQSLMSDKERITGIQKKIVNDKRNECWRNKELFHQYLNRQEKQPSLKNTFDLMIDFLKLKISTR